MKASLYRRNISVSQLTLLLGFWMVVGACSSTPVKAPEKASTQVLGAPEAPSYAFLPHPQGYALDDLKSLFADKRAPRRPTLDKCDADFRAIQARFDTPVERNKATQDLVSNAPTTYHWCFYAKILDLEESLVGESYVDEKQKNVLDTYDFLTPVARSFVTEFKDSRYLRWAIRDYRRLSEAYFFRRVDIPPKTSKELLELGEPYVGAVPALSDSKVIDKKLLDARAQEADEVSIPEEPSKVDSVKPERTAAAVPATDSDSDSNSEIKTAQDTSTEALEPQADSDPARTPASADSAD